MKKVETQIEKEAVNFRSFFKGLPTKSFKTALLIIFLLFVGVVGTSPGSVDPTNVQSLVEFNRNTIYSQSVRDRAHKKLVDEVKKVTYEIVPNTQIDLEYLVNMCETYEMDIIFVLAQGILESHLGTKGKAIKTNSVWNVGTYDNGKILYYYDSPNESIGPYFELLKERYLVDKDLHNLVQDRGYINDDGKRFATARGYENALRKLMIQIDMSSSISMYQEIRLLSDEEIMAYFGPTKVNISNNLQANNLISK